jgi:hypothetical protein
VIAEDYGNEASIEDLIDAVGILVKRDRDAYVASLLERSERVDEKDLVLACLDGCQEHLSNASMAWYASTK